MCTRLGAILPLVLICAGTSGRAQTPPADCAPPDSPTAIRLALLIADLYDLPFTGIGRVSVRPVAGADSGGAEAAPGFLDQWYCSGELPRGAYMVEVRAVNFDCTAIRIAESDTGLVVRLIRLRPDPWLPPQRQRRFPWAFDPALSVAERLSSRRCGVSAGS